jgi:hypothetical protein
MTPLQLNRAARAGAARPHHRRRSLHRHRSPRTEITQTKSAKRRPAGSSGSVCSTGAALGTHAPRDKEKERESAPVSVRRMRRSCWRRPRTSHRRRALSGGGAAILRPAWQTRQLSGRGVAIGCQSPCQPAGGLSAVSAERLGEGPLHSCSGCFRLERSPGGTCTHWKAPPYHGAHPKPTSGPRRLRAKHSRIVGWIALWITTSASATIAQADSPARFAG